MFKYRIMGALNKKTSYIWVIHDNEPFLYYDNLLSQYWRVHFSGYGTWTKYIDYVHSNCTTRKSLNTSYTNTRYYSANIAYRLSSHNTYVTGIRLQLFLSTIGDHCIVSWVSWISCPKISFNVHKTFFAILLTFQVNKSKTNACVNLWRIRYINSYIRLHEMIFCEREIASLETCTSWRHST